jgi:prophage tail gpP-like protein
MYPLQSDGLTLRQIAKKFTDRFGLKLIVDSSVAAKMDQVIEKTTAEPTTKIKDYLSDIASQRKIIITHDVNGNLVFTQPKTDKAPIFHFNGNIPGTTLEMSFNGQPIHSHITVMKQASSKGGNAGQVTIKNPYCPVAYVYRPITIIQSSGDDNTVEDLAMQALAAELKNITLTIKTDRWETENGDIILPNNMITCEDHELFLYKKTSWFIEEVDLEGDEQKTIATIKCVLPEVYNGQMPKNIFVNPHENLPRF